MDEIGRQADVHLCHITDHLIVEETDATNELINDGELVQPLTLEEIEVLKKSGVHASVRSCRASRLL